MILTLYPIPGPSESDRLLFEKGIRNDIVIQFRGRVKEHGHHLHEIELLDETGREKYKYRDIRKMVVENGKVKERNEAMKNRQVYLHVTISCSCQLKERLREQRRRPVTDCITLKTVPRVRVFRGLR